MGGCPYRKVHRGIEAVLWPDCLRKAQELATGSKRMDLIALDVRLGRLVENFETWRARSPE